MTPFTQEVISIIRSIPKGKVMSYKQIAIYAGNHRAAGQVSRILHSCTQKYNLPWHRVVNSQGKISLQGDAYFQQLELLQSEGIEFGVSDRIDLQRFGFTFTK